MSGHCKTCGETICACDSAQSDLTVRLAAIRPKFEKWYMAEMCTSALFERWMDTDYYENINTQIAWRGYQAAVAEIKAANV